MSRYYYPINLDKKEYLESHNLDTGLQLGQIKYSEPGGTASAVIHLIHNRWRGDRIALISDAEYALWDEVLNTYEDISNEIACEMAKENNKEYKGYGNY